MFNKFPFETLGKMNLNFMKIFPNRQRAHLTLPIDNIEVRTCQCSMFVFNTAAMPKYCLQ